MEALHSGAHALVREADAELENVPLEWEQVNDYLRQAIALIDLHADMTPDGPIEPSRPRKEARRG
jgi:hypothetical protein